MLPRASLRPSVLAGRLLTGPVAFFLAGAMDWGRLLATLGLERAKRVWRARLD